jgi:hypothetical protein
MGDDHGNGICLVIGFFVGVLFHVVVAWAVVHVRFV